MAAPWALTTPLSVALVAVIELAEFVVTVGAEDATNEVTSP